MAIVGQHRLLYTQSGFTLVELLVVMVVMGIVLGLVAVQLMPDNRAVLREEAQRLALLLENAGMEARASGRPLAWSAELKGYRFWNKNDYGEWVRLEDNGIFHARDLPEGIGISEVSVETKPLKAGELMSLNAFSFTLPFKIRMSSSENGAASVTGSSTGAVSAKLDSE
jgi:general secretion pathway protein H